MKKTSEETMEYVYSFLDQVNKNFQDYCDRARLGLIKEEHFAVQTIGRKYIKISQFCGAGKARSVHSFINANTGDIYKPASWKAPAKHARGNIFSHRNGGEALAGNGDRHEVRYL